MGNRRPDLQTDRQNISSGPFRQTSLSDQFVRPVYHTSLSDQFMRPFYKFSLSDQFIKPPLCIYIVFISQPVFMKTRQLYQSNDMSFQSCLWISLKKGYTSNHLWVHSIIKKWPNQTHCVSCFTIIHYYFCIILPVKKSDTMC